MIIAIVGIVILALMLAVVVAIAKDRGPGPGDAAVAYELAWDRLDFESLFTLSGAELRDGLDRHGFVAAKRDGVRSSSDASAGSVDRVGVDQVVERRRRRGGRHPRRARATARSCTTAWSWPAATRGGRWWRTGSSPRPRTRPRAGG